MLLKNLMYYFEWIIVDYLTKKYYPYYRGEVEYEKNIVYVCNDIYYANMCIC